ncbi:MAG TPA: GntR family transcriptional regulator [Alphaproteobacteria bacterium]|nr:GntR family transcriptional regulator [Alphaproteobacteria bacterium]
MVSQVDQVVMRIREMIVEGRLSPGERLAEIPLSQELGVSRQPVRFAFKILEGEGLVQQNETRGYRVRPFRQKEITDALEVRGALEGLAARLVAEAGMSRALRAELQECLDQGDAIFQKGSMSESDAPDYSEMNRRFHSAIIEGCDNAAIARALSLNDHLPFSSAGAIAFNEEHKEREYRRFLFAHSQHHVIFSAIDNRQGARAAAAMQEHANSGQHYTELFRNVDPQNDQFEVVHATKLTL